MSRKLDLDLYLSKYQSDEYRRKPTPIDGNTHRFKQPVVPQLPQMHYRTATTKTHDYDTGMPAQDYLEATRNLTNREQINADFHDSQSECLHLLHQLRRKLADEESALSMFMDNYLKELEQSLMREHFRIRDQFLQMLEKTFEQNEKRVRDMLRAQGNAQPQQFANIRKRIGQVSTQLDRLEHNLRSDNYKQTIAQIVTSDFEAQTKEIQTIILNAQKTLMDGVSKLHIDQNRYNRICDDVAHLVMVEDTLKPARQHSQAQFIQPRPASPYVTVTPPEQNNRSRMSRTKLFSQRATNQDGGRAGSFFNFNS